MNCISVESLKRAFQGAYEAYCVTFFWGHLSPEKELAQAKSMAEAAKHAGLKHVIWSTLEDTRKWVPLTDDRMPTLLGKYKVPHFDAKGGANQIFTAKPNRRCSMAISKETASLNMPWEQEYGYSQAVRVGDTIYLSGQVSHDDTGKIVGLGNMETQMRRAYANVQKVLARYGATMADIVDEVLFVTDMDAAFAARVKCRQEVFSGNPVVASTIVQIQRLAFPDLMIEIKCIAKV